MIGIDYASVDGNGPPNWHSARAAGVTFVIVRGAYGNWIDTTFQRDYAGIAAAGLVRGAYLFLRYPRKGQPSPPQPHIQARALIDALGRQARSKLDLPPCLDIEFPGDGRRETELSAHQALEWTRVAWRTMKDALGVSPLVYTSARVWKEDLANLPAPDLADSPLWLARYPYRTRIAAMTEPGTVHSLAWPPTPPPWGDQTNSWIHQYQGDALKMPGFTATVDVNRFRYLRPGAVGDRVAWLQRRLGRTVTATFDEDLAKVVREFQRLSGLGVDGIVGPQTFAQLCWADGAESAD